MSAYEGYSQHNSIAIFEIFILVKLVSSSVSIDFSVLDIVVILTNFVSKHGTTLPPT
jgi:hypothetical protein